MLCFFFFFFTSAQHSKQPSHEAHWKDWRCWPGYTILQLHIGLPLKQIVQIASHTSSTLVLNTGAPQGCVLSPLLFTLGIHDCTPDIRRTLLWSMHKQQSTARHQRKPRSQLLILETKRKTHKPLSTSMEQGWSSSTVQCSLELLGRLYSGWLIHEWYPFTKH